MIFGRYKSIPIYKIGIYCKIMTWLYHAIIGHIGHIWLGSYNFGPCQNVYIISRNIINVLDRDRHTLTEAKRLTNKHKKRHIYRQRHTHAEKDSRIEKHA